MTSAAGHVARTERIINSQEYKILVPEQRGKRKFVYISVSCRIILKWAALRGSPAPTFRDNLSVHFQGAVELVAGSDER
jgi:hypothetical protein